MIADDEKKVMYRMIIVLLLIAAVMWGMNEATGILTKEHLKNEVKLAMEHGADSQIYQEMVDELIEDANAPEHWERKSAAMELGHLKVGVERAVPVLKELLKDDVQGVRTEAAIALARIGNHSQEAVDALIEVLSHHNNHDKMIAIKSLGMIGADAAAAIPALAHELRNGHPEMKGAVEEALRKIGTPEARKQLEKTHGNGY